MLSHRSLDRARVLTLSGERSNDLPAKEKRRRRTSTNDSAAASAASSACRDDIDPESATASYKDGVLHISIKRRAAAIPRRIDIH